LTAIYRPVIRTRALAKQAVKGLPVRAFNQQYRLEKAGPADMPSIGFEHEDEKMFAVFKTGGKQYRVAAEDVLKVDKVKGEPGQIVEFGEVLVVGGDSVTLGAPTIAGATVAAEVLDQARGPKIIAFKKRRRKNSRRKRGHRQEFTLLRITEILTDGNKPSKTASPRPKRAPAPKPEEPAAETSAAAAGGSEAASQESRKTPAKKLEKPKAKAPAGKTKKPAAKAKSPPKGKKKK
jgi:large subunit ribosomal protein L21